MNKKNLRYLLISLNCIFVSITVYFSFFRNEKKVLIYPKAVLAFQTSNATHYKAKQLEFRYKNEKKYHSLLVASKDVKSDVPIELFCDCDDLRLSAHGLNCRLDCAIRYFYNNFYSPWLFVGGDDDWINIQSFDRIIDSLNKLYDPFKEVIFAGNIQQMYNMSFPHGGPGWIASRKFISQVIERNLSAEAFAKRGQWVTDDVAVGLFIKEHFKNLRFWASPWSMVCLPLDTWIETFINKKWNTLKPCPDEVLLPSVRDIYSVHMAPFQKKWIPALNEFQNAPKNVKLVADRFVRTNFCWCNKKWCDLNLDSVNLKKHLKPG